MKNTYPIFTTVSNHPQTICHELPETVFDYPFFNDGVLQEKGERVKKCTLDTIQDNNSDNLLELKGLIFNISHCGSTLLSRMLNQINDVRIVSESEAINGLLLSKAFYNIKDETIIKQLKTIVNSYQQSVDSKQSLILKLTSWNIYMMPLFQQAFPDVKWIYLDRATEPLLKSLQKSDGGFIDWWKHPVDTLRKYFLAEKQTVKTKEEYLRALIDGHRKHAIINKNDNGFFIEYPTFIHQYESIITHLELSPSSVELKATKDLLRYNSKSMKQEVWIKD